MEATKKKLEEQLELLSELSKKAPIHMSVEIAEEIRKIAETLSALKSAY